MSKFNKKIWFLLCAIDLFSKHTQVIPLNDKKGITIANVFRKVLNKLDCKPNKIWADTGSEFYSSCFKKCLKDNDIEMYSTHNEKNQLLLKDLLEL